MWCTREEGTKGRWMGYYDSWMPRAVLRAKRDSRGKGEEMMQRECEIGEWEAIASNREGERPLEGAQGRRRGDLS